MYSSGLIEFGAHSATHRAFSGLSRAEIEVEIVDSCESLARVVDRPPSELPFAYPYGALTPWAEQVVRARCKAGFITGNRRVVALDRDSAIPRINLDPDALGRAWSAGRTATYRALLEERARIRIRHGPAWRLVGPPLRTFRALRDRIRAGGLRGGA